MDSRYTGCIKSPRQREGMKHTHRNQLRHFLKDPERRRKQNREAQERWRQKHGIPKETADHKAKHREYGHELRFRFRRTKGRKGSFGRGISIVSEYELRDPTFVTVSGWKRISERLNEPLRAELSALAGSSGATCLDS
jgi:hypothetical protein